MFGGAREGLMAWALLIMPLAALGQTRVSLPRNKYSVQQDVQLGRQAAHHVEGDGIQAGGAIEGEVADMVANLGEHYVLACFCVACLG